MRQDTQTLKSLFHFCTTQHRTHANQKNNIVRHQSEIKVVRFYYRWKPLWSQGFCKRCGIFFARRRSGSGCMKMVIFWSFFLVWTGPGQIVFFCLFQHLRPRLDSPAPFRCPLASVFFPLEMIGWMFGWQTYIPVRLPRLKYATHSPTSWSCLQRRLCIGFRECDEGVP